MQSYGRMIIDPVQHINLNLALYIKLLFCSSQLIIQIKKKKKKRKLILIAMKLEFYM